MIYCWYNCIFFSDGHLCALDHWIACLVCPFALCEKLQCIFCSLVVVADYSPRSISLSPGSGIMGTSEEREVSGFIPVIEIPDSPNHLF